MVCITVHDCIILGSRSPFCGDVYLIQPCLKICGFLGTQISSTNKTDCHNKTELAVWLKVESNTKSPDLKLQHSVSMEHWSTLKYSWLAVSQPTI